MRSQSFIRVLLAVSLACSNALAAEEPSVEREAGGDRFTAGGSVNVTTPVAADLLAAGGNVTIDTRIGGDLIAAGGQLRARGEVAESAFVAGGQVNFDARVKRSVRAGGGHVEFGPRAELGGNLSVAGGQVRIEGPVFGYVQAAGGEVVLDGPVGGDVWVTGGRIALGPNARIGGKLHYATRGDLDQDPAAIVKGGIEKIDFEAAWPREHEGARHRGFAGWIWTLGLMALAAVIVGAAPAFSARTSTAMRQRPWFSLLIGFIVLVCVPVAAVLLLATVIGVPLALLVLLAYPAGLLLGYELTSICIGDWVMHRFVAARAQHPGWRAAAAAAAVLVLALIVRIPVLGAIVALGALLAGLGALALQFRRTTSAA